MIGPVAERLAPRPRGEVRDAFWKVVVAQYGALELQGKWRRAGKLLEMN